MATATTRESGRGLATTVLIMFVLLAALALRLSTFVRLAPPPSGHAADEIVLIPSDGGDQFIGGPDSYYHLRRAQLAAEGQLLAQDNWTNFPAGGVCHWPPAYARLLGFFSRHNGGYGRLPLKLLPVAAGLLALLAVIPLLRRRYDRLAWYPLLVLALAPAAVFPTVYGAIDHHCAEILFSLLALAGLAAGGITGALLMLAAIVGAWASAPSWPLVGALVLAGTAVRRLPGLPALAILLAGSFATLSGSIFYLADPWLAAVAEAQPLLSAGTFFRAVTALSPGFLMLPVTCLWWWRARHEGAAAGLLAMTMLALPLTLVEARFTIFLVAPAAAALMETLRWLYRRGARHSALVMAALCLLPFARGLAELPDWSQDLPGTAATARYLKQNLPPAGNPLAPRATPAYGVAARWDWGHHLLALGNMPVAANPFHTSVSGRELAHGIFFSAPATATALADASRIRCLVLDDFAANGYADRYRAAGNVPLYQSLWYRLYYDNDSTLGWQRHGAFTADGVAVQVWTRDGWPDKNNPSVP